MQYLLEGESSERLYFRKISIDDFDSWLDFHKDPRSTLYWKGDYGSPDEECQKWYNRQLFRYENNLGGHNALIEKKTKNLVGHCGLLVQEVDGNRELEIGYSLLPKYWGHGFATEAAKKCMDFAFQNKFAERLISIISLTNIPSQKVAKNIGMQIGKDTRYHGNDVHIFEMSKEEWKFRN